MRSVRTTDREAQRPTTHWPWAIAAAVVLIGWRAFRRERSRARERALHADAHRWEGEGGRVLG